MIQKRTKRKSQKKNPRKKKKSSVNSDLERELLKNGYDFIIGIDEVGRGCWAGPVVVGSYVFSTTSIEVADINDSKKLSHKQRQTIRDKLVENYHLYSLALSTNIEIDNIGIVEAIKKAVIECLEKLNLKKTFCIIDGNYKFNLPLPYKSIEKGDEKHYSIAAASIIAKEYRDNLMRELAPQYPQYKFEDHVGYGTKFHLEAIKKFGVLPIHRKSYRPIREIVNNNQ